MVAQTAEPLITTTTPSRLARAAGFGRRHAVFFVVLAIAVAFRVMTHLAYPLAFFFPDSGWYVAVSLQGEPDQYRPFGYSAFLAPFVPGPMIRVAFVQHWIGLGLVVAGYAFLVRRGLWPWLAALAVLPVAVDDLQLTLEHYVASETLFTALLGAALLLLLWWKRVPMAAAAAAGLLVAAAGLTRTAGLPLVALVLVFLVVKSLFGQAGWRALVAYTLAVAAPLTGYLIWYHAAHGVYAFEQVSGRALYSRSMTIADCPRLELTDRQRLLCVPEPPSERPEMADYWGWSANSPAVMYFPSMDDNEFLRQFGVTVIRQQPGDYVRLVVKETAWHFHPKAPWSEQTWCRFPWRLPERPGSACDAAYYYPEDDPVHPPEVVSAQQARLRSVLAAYSGVARAIRGPMLGISLLIVLACAVWRPRRDDWRRLPDSLLLATTGFGLIFLSVAFGMFEPRYAATAVFLIPLAAVLALRRFGLARAAPTSVRDEDYRQAAAETRGTCLPDPGGVCANAVTRSRAG